MTWVEQLHARSALVHEQIMAFKQLAVQEGLDTQGVQERYWKLLEKLYSEEMPLAHLMDTSDIILHAEGPAALDHSPSLHAFNWLCQTAEKQLKLLAKSTVDLTNSRLLNKLDIRLTGFAPGSIYAGFKVQAPDPPPLFENEPDVIFDLIRHTIIQLPNIPTFIEDESINKGIYDAVPDSAIRDALLTALLHLSPTGKIGIHTVELSAPSRHKPATGLSQRERMVIRDALRRTKLHAPKNGAFIGEIREIDLDARRFHLRNVKACGTLRCILPDSFEEKDFKSLLGSYMEISGIYESDQNGMPRLLIVENLKKIDRPEQLDLENPAC